MTKTDKIVKEVSAIRARNNKCWMALLALALKAEPRKAKKILREITENDRKVSEWLSRV